MLNKQTARWNARLIDSVHLTRIRHSSRTCFNYANYWLNHLVPSARFLSETINEGERAAVFCDDKHALLAQLFFILVISYIVKLKTLRKFHEQVNEVVKR